MFQKVFGTMRLPLKPAMAADGARIDLIEGDAAMLPGMTEEKAPFFGGYAEDFLGDMGFEAVSEAAPAREGLRKKL